MGSKGIVDRWVQYREQKTVKKQRGAELSELVERMVADSDPSLRQVEGYREQLKGPVEKALGHIQTLIGAIPGPFKLSAAGWDKDPFTHALFVSPDEIRSLLKKCADLMAFFHKSGSKSATALLTATKKEKTVFGTALEGEILRRDVPYKAVEFYDHRVVAPAGTEAEQRKELVHRGLYVLASNALEEFIQSKSIREELEAVKSLERLQALSGQLEALENYARLARMRYDEGFTSYLEVLDAERSLFNIQLTYTEAQNALFRSLIDIYKSMGGGWVDIAAEAVSPEPVMEAGFIP